MSKSRLRRLSKHHMLVLASAVLGSTIMAFAVLEFVVHKRVSVLAIACMSSMKELSDTGRHFLEVWEATHTEVL